jgi:hypothetical protein
MLGALVFLIIALAANDYGSSPDSNPKPKVNITVPKDDFFHAKFQESYAAGRYLQAEQHLANLKKHHPRIQYVNQIQNAYPQLGEMVEQEKAVMAQNRSNEIEAQLQSKKPPVQFIELYRELERIGIADLDKYADLLEEAELGLERIQAEQAERFRLRRIKEQFGYNGYNLNLVAFMRPQLHDPKSFEHVRTTYEDKGDTIVVRMTYRARNGFGGLVLNQCTAELDSYSGAILSFRDR